VYYPTFRIAIVFMIFVNDGAGGYWWLEHATWNGLAAGDLVFPAFLWIMGVCIPLSVKSAFAKGVPRWKIVMHILRVSKKLRFYKLFYYYFDITPFPRRVDVRPF
jgi:heparan-alpha-glucosaminide N-acetyltransferase